MKVQKFVFALLTVFTATAIAGAQAPSWNHKSLVTFPRQTEIPGRIVPPGQYVLKLAVPESHVAQLLSTDETQVFGIFFTKTQERESAAGLGAQLLLEPRQKGAARWDRLTGWFSPGEPVGDEVSYDKYHPVEPSR